MSERTREERSADERSAEQAREADEQAREAEEKARAAEKQTDAEHDEEKEAEGETREGPIGPWLSRSPSSRLALALSVAGVPLAGQLEPYVVEFDWRADGRFELRLDHGVSFPAGETALAFEAQVTGRAAYNGLTELDGVSYADAEGQGAIETITADTFDGALLVRVVGLGAAVKMPIPADAPDMTV